MAGSDWIQASALISGMKLVDRNNNLLTVVSQTKLDKTDTVYKFEVDEFHTFHIDDFGVWVHNADCCVVLQTCGRTISNRTANALNETYGTNLNRREIGRALEDLKRQEGLPADHHGKIWSN